MSFPFTNQVLTEVIDKRRPVATPVFDAVYTSQRNLPVDMVQVDVIEGPEGILVAVGRDAESLKADQRLVSSKTVMIPRFTEHDIISSMDQIKYRAPGVVGGGMSFESLVTDKLDNMRRKADRTKELMAIKAMQGQVVDGAGKVLATYPVPIPVSVDFELPDAVDAFDDAITAISRVLGMPNPTILGFCGVDAYKFVRNNPLVQELLKSGQNSTLLTTGALPMIQGVTLNRLVGQYTDNAGQEQSFLDDDES